jgi:hypothetical protein
METAQACVDRRWALYEQMAGNGSKEGVSDG